MSLTKELEISIDNDDRYKIVGSLRTKYNWYRVIYEEDSTTILLAVYSLVNYTEEMCEFYVFRGLNSLCDLLAFFTEHKIRFSEIRGDKEFIASIVNELMEEIAYD